MSFLVSILAHAVLPCHCHSNVCIQPVFSYEKSQQRNLFVCFPPSPPSPSLFPVLLLLLSLSFLSFHRGISLCHYHSDLAILHRTVSPLLFPITPLLLPYTAFSFHVSEYSFFRWLLFFCRCVHLQWSNIGAHSSHSPRVHWVITFGEWLDAQLLVTTTCAPLASGLLLNARPLVSSVCKASFLSVSLRSLI